MLWYWLERARIVICSLEYCKTLTCRLPIYIGRCCQCACYFMTEALKLRGDILTMPIMTHTEEYEEYELFYELTIALQNGKKAIKPLCLFLQFEARHNM